ncbi:hypothetical protein U1Q18_013907, partial [Sarracenia purpurea var. burkii]
ASQSRCALRMPMGIFPETIIKEVTYLDSETAKDLNKSSGDEGEDEACAVGETNRPSSEVEDKVFVKMPRSESVAEASSSCVLVVPEVNESRPYQKF